MLPPAARSLSRLLGTMFTTNPEVSALGRAHGFIGRALALVRALRVLARAGSLGLYAYGLAYLWKRGADSPGVVPLNYGDKNFGFSEWTRRTLRDLRAFGGFGSRVRFRVVSRASTSIKESWLYASTRRVIRHALLYASTLLSHYFRHRALNLAGNPSSLQQYRVTKTLSLPREFHQGFRDTP